VIAGIIYYIQLSKQRKRVIHMKYHIILEIKGTCRQLSQRAQSYTKAVKRARKLAMEKYPNKYLTNTSTGCIIGEYKEMYVVESE
jgi:hypothetical protein